MKKMLGIFLVALPVLAMMALIPFVTNDYWLTFIYILVIVFLPSVKKKSDDVVVIFFGFFIMTFFEYVFVSTGVETFQRHTLLGVMPLWLPVLWAYGFVAMKRAVQILSA